MNFRMKDSLGWQTAYTSPRMDATLKHIALNTKFGPQSAERMLAAACANNYIHLWSLTDGNGGETKMGQNYFIFDYLRFYKKSIPALGFLCKIKFINCSIVLI